MIDNFDPDSVDFDLFDVDRSFEIRVAGETFRGEFPLPAESAIIAANVSDAFGGLNTNNLPYDEVGRQQMIATLQFAIKHYPPGWPKDRRWANCGNPDLPLAVWMRYREAREAFLAKLKKNDHADQPAETGEPEEPAEPVGAQTGTSKAIRLG